NELQVYINSKRPGDVVKVTIYRDGKTMDKEVTLKPRSDDNNQVTLNEKKGDIGNKGTSSETVKSLGLAVSDVSSQLKDKYSISGGAMVTSVDKFSDAFMRGIQEGFVIVEANKKKVNSANDLSDAISGKGSGDSVLLKVLDKNGQERIVAVKLQ